MGLHTGSCPLIASTRHFPVNFSFQCVRRNERGFSGAPLDSSRCTTRVTRYADAGAERPWRALHSPPGSDPATDFWSRSPGLGRKPVDAARLPGVAREAHRPARHAHYRGAIVSSVSLANSPMVNATPKSNLLMAMNTASAVRDGASSPPGQGDGQKV